MQATSDISLLSLPEELLDHIVFFMPGNALLKLACTCRYLNTKALFHYFKTSGTLFPDSRVTLQIFNPSHYSARNDRETIYALRIAFSLHHIRVLECRILQIRYPDSEEPLPSNTFTPVFNELYDLLERLDHVDRIQLHVSHLPSSRSEPGSLKKDIGQPSEAKKWGQSYGRLMNMLMKKSSSVELKHDIAPFHSYREISRTPLSFIPLVKLFWSHILGKSPYHSPFTISIPWPARELEWTDEWGRSFTEEDVRAISPIIDKDLKVKSLTLSGKLMLQPPCLNWLASIFKHSHLTSLILRAIDVDLGYWTAIIPLISPSLTQLQHLSIDRCWIPAAALVWLLDDVPNLQSLDLSTDAREPDGTLPLLPPSSFLHLSRLTASPRWLLYILGIREGDIQFFPNMVDGQQLSSSFDLPRKPDSKMHLPSLTELIINWSSNELYTSSDLSTFLRIPSIIPFFHSLLQPRKPTFKHLGLRSFQYDFGKIGLYPVADEVFPGTSINRLDMPEYGLLDVVQLRFWSSELSTLLGRKELLEQWLRCFHSLKVLELVCQSSSLLRSDANHAEFVTVVKEILSTLYRGHDIEVVMVNEFFLI